MSLSNPGESGALGGVLVAEDEQSEQFLLRRAFKKAGLDLRIDFVSDGYGVLRYLRNPPEGVLPSLLLLDLRMPGLGGFDVLEWLQQQPELRPAYVVILSSSLLGTDIARANKLGVDHYLVKPRDPLELVATVKRLEPYWTEQKPLAVPLSAGAEFVHMPQEAFSYAVAM
jgi:CheY-like chemotaxis protein